MKTSRLIVLAVVIIALAAGLAAAGPPAKTSCTDVPIWISVVPSDGGVLTNDAYGPYKANVDGVNFAMINICGKSPTYDATLSLLAKNSKRWLGISFPAAIDGSVIAGPSPAWANGVAFWTKPVFYVKNILWGRMNGQYTFTTRLFIDYIVGPNDAAVYDLRLQPLVTDALSNSLPHYPLMNTPNSTSTVTVQDIPGTCRTTPGGTLDSWLVTVDSPFVATLYAESGSVHSGQYTMPFKLLVEAQACIPAALTR
jgi:hypothetical protein